MRYVFLSAAKRVRPFAITVSLMSVRDVFAQGIAQHEPEWQGVALLLIGVALAVLIFAYWTAAICGGLATLFGAIFAIGILGRQPAGSLAYLASISAGLLIAYWAYPYGENPMLNAFAMLSLSGCIGVAGYISVLPSTRWRNHLMEITVLGLLLVLGLIRVIPGDNPSRETALPKMDIDQREVSPKPKYSLSTDRFYGIRAHVVGDEYRFECEIAGQSKVCKVPHGAQVLVLKAPASSDSFSTTKAAVRWARLPASSSWTNPYQQVNTVIEPGQDVQISKGKAGDRGPFRVYESQASQPQQSWSELTNQTR